MATTTVTGRSLTLTVGAKTYADQGSSVTLNLTNNQQVLETLAGRAFKTVDYSGTLDVEMYADWGVATGLCATLWDAAKSAPDTSLTFTFVAGASPYSTITGKVFPAFPPQGGAATDVLTTSVSFVIDTSSAITRA
jgi:hypothetical protein